MVDIAAETITPRGVGVAYVNLEGPTFTVPASRTGIAHVRNRGATSVTLTAVIADDGGPDSLGPRQLVIEVPPSATRFIALPLRIADPQTRLITFTVTGDFTGSSVTVLERA
jgi:hypothetical protein